MAWFSLIPSPQPAQAAPPAVSVSSGAGDVLRYAMENHTHASKTRRQVVTMPSAASTYTWTYPVAFGTGVVPAVCGIVQVAAGNQDLFNIQVLGEPTNTQCSFQINRVSSGLLSLLLGALSLNPTPVAARLHLFAIEP